MKRTLRIKRLLLIIVCIAAAIAMLFAGTDRLCNGFMNAYQRVLADEVNDSSNIDDSIPVIMLDAGHGGYDSGSLSVYGQAEKDITLELTLLIGERLEEAGYSVAYTRTSDEVDWPSDNRLDLRARVEKAVEADADYYISIHTNASEEGIEAYGFETYVDLQDTQMVEMAQSVHAQLDQINYSYDRGLKDGVENQLYVISSNPVAAMLIEIGFITDDEDLWAMTMEQESLAQAIAQGIIQSIEE